MSEAPVVDASPLVILAKAGLLDLLTLEGETVHVPAAVAREVQAHGDDQAAMGLSRVSWLLVVQSPTVPSSIAAWDLGEGESSVLAWAVSHPPSVAVLDDLAARRCAAAHGVPYRGCLGLALLAKRRGRVSAARPLVQRLRDAGLWISDGVVNRALALIGE